MIVITGASSGLGAELAKLYDAEGKATYLTGRSESKLSTVTNCLSNNVGYRACDLASHQEVEQLFEQLDSIPSTVVHSAGRVLWVVTRARSRADSNLNRE